jgi:S-formylglutathione hydrolase
VSAFAPICNPVQCSWGQTCFGAYLGENKASWEAWDATCLIRDGAGLPPALIDQGTADEFLADQLYPQNLEAACAARNIPVTLRQQGGYDHSYHFIATFIGEHLRWHADRLRT